VVFEVAMKFDQVPANTDHQQPVWGNPPSLGASAHALSKRQCDEIKSSGGKE